MFGLDVKGISPRRNKEIMGVEDIFLGFKWRFSWEQGLNNKPGAFKLEYHGVF